MANRFPKIPLVDKEPVNKYLRFSGLVFQLLAAILVGYFLGNWLDGKAGNETPYWTAGLILLFLSAYLLIVIRSLSKGQ